MILFVFAKVTHENPQCLLSPLASCSLLDFIYYTNMLAHQGLTYFLLSGIFSIYYIFYCFRIFYRTLHFKLGIVLRLINLCENWVLILYLYNLKVAELKQSSSSFALLIDSILLFNYWWKYSLPSSSILLCFLLILVTLYSDKIKIKITFKQIYIKIIK